MGFLDGLFVAPGWDDDRRLSDALGLKVVASIYLLRGLPVEGNGRHREPSGVRYHRRLEKGR